jgi:chromosomal replication initiation ATPase DnaA
MFDELIEAVERIFNLEKGDIRSRKRPRHINEARDAVCLVARMAKYSNTEIGRQIGGRLRLTVLRSSETAQGLKETDEGYKNIIDYLEETYKEKLCSAKLAERKNLKS